MKKFWSGLIIFVVGVGLGFSGQGLIPNSVSSYLPKALQVQNEVLEGLVVRKHREGDRLLLTVSTPRGALLATFQNQISEIDLLVDEGDRVTLGLVNYEPFVHDPSVKGVMKPDQLPKPVEPQLPLSDENQKLPDPSGLEALPSDTQSTPDAVEPSTR